MRQPRLEEPALCRVIRDCDRPQVGCPGTITVATAPEQLSPSRIRDPPGWPVFECRDGGVLHQLLGSIPVAKLSYERTDEPSALLAQHIGEPSVPLPLRVRHDARCVGVVMRGIRVDIGTDSAPWQVHA